MAKGKKAVLAAGIAACLTGILILSAAFLPGIFGMSTAIVSSGSMSPVLEPGDAIYFRVVDPADVSPGDVIVFRAANGLDTVHRAIRNDAFEKYVTTKGDANRETDPEPVPYADIKGVLAFRCHGWLSAFLSGSGTAAAVFLLGAGCMLLVMAATYEAPKVDTHNTERRDIHDRHTD